MGWASLILLMIKINIFKSVFEGEIIVVKRVGRLHKRWINGVKEVLEYRQCDCRASRENCT